MRNANRIDFIGTKMVILNMRELFEIPRVDSPRRAWIKKHDVRTKRLPMSYEDDNSWAAWVGDLEQHHEQNTAL